MTQYLMAVHHPATGPTMTDEEMQKSWDQTAVFNEELQQSGSWVFAGGLFPVEVATVVDATGAEVITTDGPYAESKEYLGGFWVIEASDLDAALDWARKASAACMAPVEVRPFQG